MFTRLCIVYLGSHLSIYLSFDPSIIPSPHLMSSPPQIATPASPLHPSPSYSHTTPQNRLVQYRPAAVHVTYRVLIYHVFTRTYCFCKQGKPQPRATVDSRQANRNWFDSGGPKIRNAYRALEGCSQRGLQCLCNRLRATGLDWLACSRLLAFGWDGLDGDGLDKRALEARPPSEANRSLR
jgi:hypothetical protein